PERKIGTRMVMAHLQGTGRHRWSRRASIKRSGVAGGRWRHSRSTVTVAWHGRFGSFESARIEPKLQMRGRPSNGLGGMNCQGSMRRKVLLDCPPGADELPRFEHARPFTKRG